MNVQSSSLLQATHDADSEKLSQQSRLFANLDKELAQLEQRRKQCTQEANAAEMERKKLAHDIERYHKDLQTVQDVLDRLVVENEWIPSQEQ